MSVFAHIVVFLSYCAIFSSLGVFLFRDGFLDLMSSILVGGGFVFTAFVVQLLLHLLGNFRTLSRRQHLLRGELLDQAQTLHLFHDRLTDTKEEIDDQLRQRNKELLGEVHVLQTLLRQTLGAQNGETPSQEGVSVSAAVGPRVLSIMRNALEENRLELHVQPIVQLPNRRTVYYECFARVRDEHGKTIFPAAFLTVAQEEGMSGALDNLILFRCVQMIRQLGARRADVKFFCNISSASLQDETFFGQFVEFMSANVELADRLVFEFDYQEAQNFSRSILSELARLAKRGYRFSVDNVDSVDIDLGELAKRNIGFVKMDARNFLQNATSGLHPADLNAQLKRVNVDLIITRVEDEETIVEVLDRNADFAQGYLFGEPRLSKIDQSPSSPSHVSGAA